MVDLQELEAIKRLKYRYVRCLDTKNFDELERCLTEDATAAYSSGKYAFTGRAAIMTFLREAMSSPRVLSSHRVHEPEIDFTSPTTARGLWALDDVFINEDSKITVRGAAFYDDQYVKIDGEWKIRHTGYKRLYEEAELRTDRPSLQVTARWCDRE
ncbi:MAG: nuclear transport factor 2 family protein [Candidatus Binatia bacterium]